MSKIKLELHTNDNGEVEVSLKGACTVQELEIATGFMMIQLATSSTTGWEVLSSIMSEIETNMAQVDGSN
jgi:hypothetical protein